jgi:hypothetical protein
MNTAATLDVPPSCLVHKLQLNILPASIHRTYLHVSQKSNFEAKFFLRHSATVRNGLTGTAL